MILKANTRDITGHKVKNLRKQGKLPASIYGPEVKPQNIVIDTKDFKKVFKQAGYSTLIDLELDDSKKVKSLVKEVQYDPVDEEFLHVSLYQVNMKKQISAEIPLKIIGESPAVKNNIGLLVTPVSTIYVSCLPINLPSHIDIDVSKFEKIGDSLQISNIKLPEGVEVDSDESGDTVLAYISAPQKSIEQEEAEAAAKVTEEAATSEVPEDEEGTGSAAGTEAKATGAASEATKAETKQ